MLLDNPFVPLTPDAVRKAATAILRPHYRKGHWTQVAALLGAVEDRMLYEGWSFRSTRAWAEAELELSPGDTLDLLRLYRVIQSSGRPLTEWAQVSKGKAHIVMRGARLGGDPGAWLGHALSSATEADLRAMLDRQLGHETFVPYTVHIPVSLVPLVREAMRRALPVAVDEEVPAEPEAQDALVQRRDTHFRCLEVICAEFLT